ncbi:MAG TPA: hypothetical protein VFE46_04425 [Pirellulales bacterium]|jgi:hypothetical protein|nr:hypothetical protein [Pirellulales bacterium]
MIAPLGTISADHRAEFVHDQFLKMLPLIRRQAWIAFRGQRAEARQELTQEVIVNAYCACIRLARRNKLAVAYPTPLAQFAIRHVRAGRLVGSQLNQHDLLFPYACRIHGFTVERIDRRSEQSGELKQLLVEDRHVGPAETAAARIDVAAWLETLSRRQRALAKGGSTREVVARQFGLCPARISQLRSWFRQHWGQFQSGLQPGVSAA